MHSVNITSDFDVKVNDCILNETDNVNSCSKYLIILYNSIDVSDQSSIYVTKLNDNTVKYDVTYNGKTKSITGNLKYNKQNTSENNLLD